MCKHKEIERVLDKTTYIRAALWNGEINDYCPNCHKSWSHRCILREHPDSTVSVIHNDNRL